MDGPARIRQGRFACAQLLRIRRLAVLGWLGARSNPRDLRIRVGSDHSGAPQRLSTGGNAAGSKAARKAIRKGPELSIADIVNALVQNIEVEIPVFYFDIISLDTRCTALLSDLQKDIVQIGLASGAEVYSLNGHTKVADRCSPLLLTLQIIQVVQKRDVLVMHDDGKFRKLGAMLDTSSAYLEALTRAMEKLVEQWGSAEVDEMASRRQSYSFGAATVTELDADLEAASGATAVRISRLETGQDDNASAVVDGIERCVRHTCPHLP